ncbi:MAG: DUF2608 domain-containing protein [Pseudomonadota bacterium]
MLLTACPHHHATCDPISSIHSLKEVDFDQTDNNTLVVYRKLPKSITNKLKAKNITLHVFKSQENLKNIFNKVGCHFNKIIFFDDKKENVASVAKVAEDLGIAYKGYIYTGTEFASQKDVQFD